MMQPGNDREKGGGSQAEEQAALVVEKLRAEVLDSTLNNPEFRPGDILLVEGRAVYAEAGVQGGERSVPFDASGTKEEIFAKLEEALRQGYAGKEAELGGRKLVRIDVSSGPVSGADSAPLKDRSYTFGGSHRSIAI